MRRPRSAGALASTGTYAAPAFMMPKKATTPVADFGSTTPDAIAVGDAVSRQMSGERR